MKKALSLILAIVMAFGCMSITAFAEETDNTTDITLTVAKSLTYDMVIPDDVTNLDNFGIFEVGQAKVANVKNATNNTVISYTAETTDFKCDDKTDIPASYYTDAEGKTAFPTAAVEVYKNNADAASIPTMYVGISENDYNAAESGTYTATVTFNFSNEEKAAKPVTAADALVTGAQFRITGGYYFGELVGTFTRTDSGFNCDAFTLNGSNMVDQWFSNPLTLNGTIISLNYGTEVYWKLKIDTSSATYKVDDGSFTKFEVKPAGATEFTEVILAEPQP